MPLLRCFLAISLAGVSVGAAESPTPVRTTPAGGDVADVVVRPADVAGPRATVLLGELNDELAPAVGGIRRLLLGSRNPNGASCVRQTKPEELSPEGKVVPMDPFGGPGTRFMFFHSSAMRRSAADDFTWCQKHFRSLLSATAIHARMVGEPLQAVRAKADRLADAAAGWKTFPEGFRPVVAPQPTDWPGYCFHALNRAVADRDLARCRRWSRELSASLFALADLRRWLEFLALNYVGALDMQAKAKVAFAWVDHAHKTTKWPYRAVDREDELPAMAQLTALASNYYEIERQAERIFRTPAEPPDTSAELAAAPAAVWLPPDLRKDFVAVRNRLPEPLRALWDRAASSAYERSFLTNMLFRLGRANVIDALIVVLGRIPDDDPPTHPSELMDVIFYRGEPCAAEIWGDRFDPRLIRAAEDMDGGDHNVLVRAHRLANEFLGGWANYQGSVWTLKEALDIRRMDCLRGTDFIGACYRNAGRHGYYIVHLSNGFAAHTLCGAEVAADGRREIVLVDSLLSTERKMTWPRAFFEGFKMPDDYPGPRGPTFTAELLVRGLDTYVFAGGYIVRGPHAGEEYRFAVPYLPAHPKGQRVKAYPGPHPTVPRLKLRYRNADGTPATAPTTGPGQ